MFKHILVPLDGSALAEQAIGTAAMIARASHGAVDLATAIEPLPFGGFVDVPWAIDEPRARKQYVEATAADLSTGASIPATGTVLKGQATEELSKHEKDLGVDLVVMTSHGRTGLSRAWLGSVADAVVRHSTVPVLVLRPEEKVLHPSKLHRSFDHILVPLDGSALSADIVKYALDLAALTKARVTLVRVIMPVPLVSAMPIDAALPYTAYVPDDAATETLANEVRDELADFGARLREKSGMAIDTQVIVSTHTAQAIMDYANTNKVDLVAMATHGRGASRMLIGSVADKVLRSSGLSVLMHRPAAVAEDGELLSEETMCDQLPAIGARGRSAS